MDPILPKHGASRKPVAVHFVDTEAEPFCHLSLDGRVGETKHSAIGVMDNDKFRPYSAGPWHVGG